MGLKNFLKYVFSLAACNVYRFLKIFPNNDPIMGVMLPFARHDKAWRVGLFAFSTMFVFDLITLRYGIWTWGTAIVYGLLAIAFATYFKRMKKVGLKTYTLAAIVGVLIFDIITGPIMTSVFFNMPFAVAAIGQIPFTLMHLGSAVAYTWALAPILDPVLAKDLASRLYNIRMHIQTNILSN
jgi:hypothetical protein